jgi:hypothetical protein
LLPDAFYGLGQISLAVINGHNHADCWVSGHVASLVHALIPKSVCELEPNR